MEYSQEQLNYFRLCYVAFNLVPEGLRKVFKTEWGFLYKTTPLGEWKDTSQNGLDFFNKESKASRKKNARCLATIRKGNAAEWDCTCLFFAILYSDSVGSTLGTGPRKKVDDLRQVRNDIAHISKAEFTDTDFQTYVGRVISTFSSLGLPIKDIEDIKNQTTFPTQEVEKLKKQARDAQAELVQTKFDLQQTKSSLQSTEANLVSAKQEIKVLTEEISASLQPFRILGLTPPHEIIERCCDIERITSKMEELYKGSNGAVSTVYLSGIPGCGKSQLAREIGQQFFSHPENVAGVVFVATLNAESIETLADSYMTLARHLGITEYALTNLEPLKREKHKEAIQQLHRLILPKVSEFTKWLIIADNVIDLRSVRNLLPQTGSKEWGHGQVLITTQDSTTIPQNAPHTYHESLSKGMQLDDAMKLLENVSHVTDQDQVKAVAEALDYQPLALAAAAYYLNAVVHSGSPNYSWREYLELARQNQQRDATENVLASESAAYSQTTTTVIKMALKRAVENDEVLRHTFSFFALCASESLPLEAVVKFVKGRLRTELPEELIKSKILRSSLILVEEVDPKCLRLHNIVHTVVKQSTFANQESDERDQNIAEAVRIFYLLLNSNKDNCLILNTLLPHCKSLVQNMNMSYFTSPKHTFLNLLSTPLLGFNGILEWFVLLANISRKLGDFPFAKYLVDFLCESQKNMLPLGEGVFTKTEIFTISGLVYHDMGKLNQAKEFHENALMIQKTFCGEENTDLATCYRNLAAVLKSLGDYKQAKELMEKELMITKKIFGAEDERVATSYVNLAALLNAFEENNQAKKLNQKALMILRKTYSEEHPKLMATYTNLGLVYESTGEYDKAKELFEKTLFIEKKIFGEDHLRLAKTYTNLGLVCTSNGEYEQARELYEKALVIERKFLGDEHADVAQTYSNLACVLQHTGELTKAKELHKRALLIHKTVLGKKYSDRSPDQARNYYNLATMHITKATSQKCTALYEKALKIEKNIFGEEHAFVAKNFDNVMSVDNESINEYYEAKELLEKAATIQEKVFGEMPICLAKSYNYLALVYASIKKFKEAEQLLKKVLVIRERMFGNEDPYVINAYHSLGELIYSNIGKFDQAKEFFEKALKLRKRSCGEENDKVAHSYTCLAKLHNSIGEYRTAKELHKKVLRIRKKIFGEFHIDVVASLYNLALVYYNTGELVQAKEFFDKALTMQKQIYQL